LFGFNEVKSDQILHITSLGGFMNITVELQTTEALLNSEWKAHSQEIEIKEIKPLKLASKGDIANFVEPVTAVIVLTSAMLVFRLFEYFKKKNERGIQIDLRTIPATLTDLANVPNGFIVIIDKDGNASIEQAKYDEPEQLAKLLEGIFG
jgi:hypothetical protein